MRLLSREAYNDGYGEYPRHTLRAYGEMTVGEERILNKLDAIEARGVETLVAVTQLQEQVKDVPDLKARVSALEKWKWTAVGALAASGTALGGQLFAALKAVS